MAFESVEKKITIAGKEITIKPLTLRKYQVVARSVSEIMKHPLFEQLQSGDGKKVIFGVTQLFQEFPDKFSEIISVTCDVDKEFALDLNIDEVISLVGEVWAINNFGDIKKKALGIFKTNQESQATP